MVHVRHPQSKQMEKDSSQWLRMVVVIGAGGALTSLGFVVNLAINQGKLEERMTNLIEQGQRERAELKDDLKTQFNLLNQQLLSYQRDLRVSPSNVTVNK